MTGPVWVVMRLQLRKQVRWDQGLNKLEEQLLQLLCFSASAICNVTVLLSQ